MIDWYVLLTPLILLPIVLLLGFVGCGLPTSGLPTPVFHLEIGPGFQTDIESIEVNFQFVLESGEAPSNLSLARTLSHDDISPEGNTIKEVVPSHPDAGEIECTCAITRMEPEAKPITRTAPPVTIVQDEYQSGYFALSRQGDDFKLEVLAYGELVFSGGTG